MSASSVDGLANQVNDEDTGFGTDNSQSTPTLLSMTNGSQLFGSLFTTINQKFEEVAITNSFAIKHQKQQGYQQHHQLHHVQKQRSFQYTGIQLQLHQENSDEVRSGEKFVGDKHLKRKKLECNHVEHDNDDACSEDEFIRKIATVAADKKEATRIVLVETLNNNNSKLWCSTNCHEAK